MKAFIFLILINFCSLQSKAQQHPLVGTWKMISAKGINADGERFQFDTTTQREIKIITPTHYALIAEDVEDGKLVFNRAYAGAVKIEGNKYIEMPLMSSLKLADNVKADFAWEIKDDTFIQSGTIVRPDGKKVVLEELVFKRISSKGVVNNPAVGTWSLISTSYNNDSKVIREGSPTIKALHLVTPTHWMFIQYRNNTFDKAMGGTYTLSGNKVFPIIDLTSLSDNKGNETGVVQNIEGDKLFYKGNWKSKEGNMNPWEAAWQRIK